MTLNADDAEFPAGTEDAPKLGKVAAERRRRPLTILFGVFVGVIVLSTSSRWHPDSGILELLFICGLALTTCGVLGRIWSNLFISGYKSRALVTCGPYSLCRNPLYFFSAVGMLGIGLSTGTLGVPTLLIIFFAAYYPMIIGQEERRLSLLHGENFIIYCRTTPAFWPRFANYAEPDRYEVFPRSIRKTLGDAFWFVAFAGLVHAVAHLHRLHWLPVLVRTW